MMALERFAPGGSRHNRETAVNVSVLSNMKPVVQSYPLTV